MRLKSRIEACQHYLLWIISYNKYLWLVPLNFIHIQKKTAIYFLFSFCKVFLKAITCSLSFSGWPQHRRQRHSRRLRSRRGWAQLIKWVAPMRRQGMGPARYLFYLTRTLSVDILASSLSGHILSKQFVTFIILMVISLILLDVMSTWFEYHRKKFNSNRHCKNGVGLQKCEVVTLKIPNISEYLWLNFQKKI